MHQECLRHIQATVPNWQDIFREVEETEAHRLVEQRQQQEAPVQERQGRSMEPQTWVPRARRSSQRRRRELDLVEQMLHERELQEKELQRHRRYGVDLPQSSRSEYTCTDESASSFDTSSLELLPQSVGSSASEGYRRPVTAGFPLSLEERHSSSGQSSSSLRSTTATDTRPPPQHRKF